MELKDLPLNMLELVYLKLTCLGRIRFGAVCKEWRTISQGLRNPRCSDHLPWVLNTERSHIFDPLSESSMTLQTSNPFKRMFPCGRLIVHASEAGWLLLQGAKQALYFYNPFLDQLLDLSHLTYNNCKLRYAFKIQGATFTIDDSKIDLFIMSKGTKPPYDDWYLLKYRIFREGKCLTFFKYRYGRNWEQLDVWGDDYEFWSMHIVGGKLCCLFKRSVLAIARCELVIFDLGSQIPPRRMIYPDTFTGWDRGWLVDDTKDNLILVFKRKSIYAAYKFDKETGTLSSMDVNTRCAFFVGAKATTSTPLKDEGGLQGCLVYHLDQDEEKTNWIIKCYSLKKKEEIPTPYLLCSAPHNDTMAFLDHPCIKT